MKDTYPGLGFRAKILKNLNASRATGLFLNPLKTSEKQRVFLFSGCIERDQQHENGLKEKVQFCLTNSSLVSCKLCLVTEELAYFVMFRKMFLTNFMLLVSFYTTCKHQKTRRFLMFSGGIERDQWHEMGRGH